LADTNLSSIDYEVPIDRTPTERWADTAQLMAVLCNDKRYQDLPGYALYVKTIPVIGYGQYAIARKQMQLAETNAVLPAPAAAILWARVSDDVHAKLLGATQMPTLTAGEWNSGDHFWIIDTPGDQKLMGGLLEALQRHAFAGQSFHAFMIKPDGALSIREFKTSP